MVNKKCSIIMLSDSVLEVIKQIICNRHILFVEMLKISKRFSDNLVNEKGSFFSHGVVSRFSMLKVISFRLTVNVLEKIETILSQLCDQSTIILNYAKQTGGLFIRIIGKISALTVLQYINKINNRPIRQVKYALI